MVNPSPEKCNLKNNFCSANTIVKVSGNNTANTVSAVPEGGNEEESDEGSIDGSTTVENLAQKK